MATYTLDDVELGGEVTPLSTSASPPPGQYTLDDVDFGLEEKSLAPPPPPEKSVSEKFKDLTTVEWGGTTPSGAPTNTFDPFEAVGSIFGIAKKPVDWLARESAQLMGLPVSDEATTGQLARSAMAPETPTGGRDVPLELLSNILTGGVPLHQMIEGVESPHLRSLIGAGVERGTEFATDPAQIAFAGKALPKAAHYTMSALMGHGVLGGGAAFYDEVKKNGFSPKALEHLATLSGDAILLALGSLPRKKGQEGAKDPEVRALLEEKGIDPDVAFAQALEKAAEEPPPAFKGTSRKESLPEGWSLKPTGEGERVRVTSPEGVGITYPNEKAARKGIASERKKIIVKPPEPERVPLVPELAPGEEALPNVWGGEVLRGEEPPPPPPGVAYKSQLSDLQQTPEEIAAAREGRMTPPPPIDVDPTKYMPSRATAEPPPRSAPTAGPETTVPFFDEPPPLGESKGVPSTKGVEVKAPPEEHLPIEMKATIQEAIETGFNAKTSIKQIQEKLGIPEEQARELYWKTKRSLQAEKRGGHLELEQIPFKAVNVPEGVNAGSMRKYLENPQTQKLHRFITNVFESVNKVVKGAIPGEERVLENNYAGLALKPGFNAFRTSAKGNLPEHVGAKGVGDIHINPWSIAIEAFRQEKSGAIPKGSAHQYFIDRVTEAIGHEPAHARARHGEAVTKDLFTGEEVVDPFNPQKMEQDFSFGVADQSVRNNPEFNRIMEGVKSPQNDASVRQMYDAILRDAREIYKDLQSRGKTTGRAEGMEMKGGLEPPIFIDSASEKPIYRSFKSQLKSEGYTQPRPDGNNPYGRDFGGWQDSTGREVSPSRIWDLSEEHLKLVGASLNKFPWEVPKLVHQTVSLPKKGLPPPPPLGELPEGKSLEKPELFHARGSLDSRKKLDRLKDKSIHVSEGAPVPWKDVGVTELEWKRTPKPLRASDQQLSWNLLRILRQEGLLTSQETKAMVEKSDIHPDFGGKSIKAQVVDFLKENGYDPVIEYRNAFEINKLEKTGVWDKAIKLAAKRLEIDPKAIEDPLRQVKYEEWEKAGAPKAFLVLDPKSMLRVKRGLRLKPIPELKLPETIPHLKGVGREGERGAVGTGGNKPINPKAPIPPINLGGHKPSSPTGKGLSVTASPSLRSKIWEEVKGISGAVRVITVGGDVSSPLRQSWIQTAAHPIRAAKNLKTIFRGLSEKGYERVGKEIEADPYYQDAVKAKAAVKEIQEEQYEGIKYLQKRAGKIAAEPFKISERGYNIYLRKVRMESFSRGMELLEGKYGKGKVPSNVKEGLARWVNTSTGRGNVAREYEAAFSAINQVLFSPRLLKSRLDTFNPREWQRLYRADPIIRNMAVTELVRAVAFMGSMVGTTAAVTGAKVEGDPRSADFGKIRIGNTSIDPWGGYQPYIRIAAQLVTKKRKTQYGDIQDVQVGDLLQRFARSKLAPLPGFAWTALEGKTFVGDRAPLDDMKTYWDSFGVMTIRDIVEIGKQDPELAVALAMPIALGVGTTTRPALPTTKKVQEEFRRLKIAPPMDVETKEDFSKEPLIDRKTGKAKRERERLSNEEFKEVKKKTDPEVWGEIEKYVSSGFYQKLSEEEKTIALHKLSRKMGSFRRKRSRELLMKPPPTARR